MDVNAYKLAQSAMTDLKHAVLILLDQAGESGMKNSEIGRALGIHGGHKSHDGHISRTVLAILENENVVEQDEGSKVWTIR